MCPEDPTELAVHPFGLVTANPLTAAAAMQTGSACKQQLEMIVDLRHRAHGGPGGLHRVGLVDGDGRRDALDTVHPRLVHSIQELAGIGRKRLHVAPLPFRIHRVEGER